MMKRLNPNLLYGLGIIVITVLVFVWHQRNQKIIISDVVATSTQNSYSNNDNAIPIIATSTYKYGNITFQALNGDDSNATLNVFQNGKKILSRNGSDFYALGFKCPWGDSDNPCDPSSSPTFGVDITGNGGKDFVLADSQPGNSNPMSYYIFELPKDGGTIKALTSIEDINYGVVFKKLNDGKFAVGLADYTFRYWSTDNVHSPQPEIVLSYQDGQYKPDLSLMRKPAPSIVELKSHAVQWTVDGWVNGMCPSSEVNCSVPWAYALDLIHSGNASAAKTYLDLAWRPNSAFGSEQEFLTKLTEQLKQSPYYNAILALNGGKIF